MFKIKPSTLESFRIYKADLFNKELSELIAEIKGERKPTGKMNMGSLIHKYIEDGTISMDFEDGTLSLCPNEVEQLRLLNLINNDYQKEARFKYNLTDNIIISGVIDAVRGFCGIEYKTGGYFYGVDFYENSIQWKLYCHAFNLYKITYVHIKCGKTRPAVFDIKDFSFYYNQEMERDIHILAGEFIEFCQNNKIEKYIEV